MAGRRPLRLFLSQLAFALLVGALAASTYTSAPLPDAVEQAANTIDLEDLRAHLRFLASDELQGRGTGHSGNGVAELYLASVFERLQLERAAGAAYLQPVELYFTKLGDASELVVAEKVDTAEVATRFEPGRDFYPHASSASRAVTADIVFAGYGITAPDYQYDDYHELDARGRIVVALDGEPQPEDERSRFLGRAPTRYASAEHKIQNAEEHGAAGLLLVRTRMRDLTSVWPDNPSVRSRHYEIAERVDREHLPVGIISTSAADALLSPPGAKPGERTAGLRKDIEAALGASDSAVRAPASFAVAGRQARLVVDLERERVIVHNVVAMIEGTDPALKQELVVIGAHMDHDGVDAEGRVYNGADDNASGTAGVLETAEAFAIAARNGRRPARTVVFALWNGEEKGDLGSEYYVRHPVPAGRLVANVNLDMIGRNEDVPDPSDFRFVGLSKTSASENTNTLHLLGYTYSPEFAALVRQENAAVGLTIKQTLDVSPQNLIRRSDQWSFLQQRVPAVFFTTGLHPDYHTPQDDVGRINFDKLQKVARLAFRVTWRLATDPELPAYVEPRAAARVTQPEP